MYYITVILITGSVVFIYENTWLYDNIQISLPQDSISYYQLWILNEIFLNNHYMVLLV